MKVKIFCCVLAIIGLLSGGAASVLGQGTAFTYQGRLADGANPANGSYDLQFQVFTASNGPPALSAALTNAATSVSNGLFTITLDFGANIFGGGQRWLEIGVRTNGGGAFITLSPRQQLTPAPYAITAENLAPGAGLSGVFSNAVNLTSPGNKFTGDGSGLTNVNVSTLGGLSASNFWQLAGNSGTAGTNNFIGTKDSQPLELRANNVRGWRLEPTADAPNIIGNPVVNFAGPGVQGVTIGGGGSITNYGTAYPNSVFAVSGTIGGGLGNTIQIGAFESTIAGGNQNTIQSNAFRSTIGGGYSNVIQSNSPDATIDGGLLNVIQAGANRSVIGGGVLNVIQSAADRSVIGGGQGNVIVGSAALPVLATIGGGDSNMTGTNSSWSTIGGGHLNVIQSTENSCTIGGGDDNNIQTGASYATISGGTLNVIGPGATDAVIAGGVGNTNQAGASFIGGGQFNLIIPSGYNAVIGGGYSNYIAGTTATISGGTGNSASYNDGTIGGGRSNTVSGADSTVGGGENNSATGNHALVAGGMANRAGADNSAIGGGWQNFVTGIGAAIPGGVSNQAAGISSFAAGQDAHALHAHSFVWGDGSQTANSTGAGRFEVLAQGGINLYAGTNFVNVFAPGTLAFGFVTRQMLNLYDIAYGIGVQDFTLYNRTAVNGGFSWFKGGVHTNSQNNPGTGGTEIMRLDSSNNLYVAGSITAHTLFLSSDRNVKAGFETVDARAILEKVAAMPITRWHFTNELARPHIGPMAQDFQAAFDLGRDDTHISIVDEGGVALAAIQGLNRKVEAKDAEIQDLKARLEKLEDLMNKNKGGVK